MDIRLSEHFDYKKLIKFTFPSIVMMVFTSIYGVVDGLFVSNFAGKTPFAAINLIMPFLMICGALGFMIGTGGSALVSKTLGEGDGDKANRIFSMLIYAVMIAGVVFSVAGLIFIRPIAVWLGAEGAMIEDCVLYGRIILMALTAFMLQNAFQALLITAGKPNLGLWIIVAAGMTNVILDALFIAVFHWGLSGAAIATAISQLVGGIIPLVYFARPNDSSLRLVSAAFDGRSLVKTCTNGASEFITTVSLSVVSMLYNFQLMKYIGEDGVAAYGVIMYVNFIFLAIFIGYSMGSAPIVGYHYGARNHSELRSLLRKSLVMLTVMAVILTALAEALATPLSKIFVGYDAELFALTRHALMIYSFSFLLAYFNIFGSAFFTALNNGFVSAAISFSRMLIFQTSAVMLLPLWFGIDGIWLAIVVAEMLSLFVTVFFFAKKRSQYHY